MSETWAVVLAGGIGSRLWPWSRRHRPKPVLEVLPGVSLLAATVQRLPVAPDRVLVVTGADMEAAVRTALPGIGDRVLVEPSPRNTAAAVAWGVAEAARRGAEVVGVFPSDHHVGDVAAFRETVRAGLAMAVERGHLTLIAIEPTRPDTGYGYLDVDQDGRVRSFVEKPDAVRAEVLVAQPSMAWNGGMFLGTVDAFRGAFEALLPQTHQAVARVVAGEMAAWTDTDRISFDHGILEKHAGVSAVRGDFGWSDLGTWEAVAPWLPAHEAGRGHAVQLTGEGDHLVVAPGRRVLMVGLPDAVVVDDGDVLVVASKESLGRLPAMGAALGDAWT